MNTISSNYPRIIIFPLLICLCYSVLPASLKARTNEEICSTCEQRVSVSGDFDHRSLFKSFVIQGAEDSMVFHEAISGENFTVLIANLPEGKYSFKIGVAETVYIRPGERVFKIKPGEADSIENIDIVQAAGGNLKVHYITGELEHPGDSFRGPVQFQFAGVKKEATFSTFELKHQSGTALSFNSGDFEKSTASGGPTPEIAGDMIWRDHTKPRDERINDLIRRMSLQEKVAQIQNDAPAIERLGLPAYNYWNEALHGVANNGIATVFPEPVGMASTWNPELLNAAGQVIGIEGRAKYNDYANKNKGNSKWWAGLTFWTPNINIFRDPRWGRGQETYGECPFLTGELVVGYIKGIQGDHPKYMLAMACAKHYAVHSGPESERHQFNAEPAERELYEIYLPQFERAVRDGEVAGVMSAYNAVYGIPCSASELLLQDILRNRWGFTGYVVSDCSAVRDIFSENQHHYVETPEEAAMISVKAGTNLCCGGEYRPLVKAVQNGMIEEEEIDKALYYTLWTRFRLGLFDPVDEVPYSKYTIKDNDTPEHGQVALEVARQSLVLLKNDGILPLDRSKYKRIAVIGPNSDSKSMLEGNYHGSASKPISILAGIKDLAGSDIEITFAMGSPVTTIPDRAAWSDQDNNTNRPIPELKAEALEHANAADLIIYVGGITPQQEGEGFDRPDMELPEVQMELLKALHATGKPMVMVNCSGSAMALTWQDENLNAILQAWYPGQNGGQAVAEVLFGAVNPSGHLPLTFYRSTEDLPEFTDYSFENRTYRYFKGEPLYAFGHGLSYTEFKYKNAKLESKKISTAGAAKLSFTIQNTGKYDGDDVAQVYYRHVNSKVPQPKMALCGFIRVSLKKGETQKVELEIPTERLRYWDTENDRYLVEPGKYEFLIGSGSDDIQQKIAFTIEE